MRVGTKGFVSKITRRGWISKYPSNWASLSRELKCESVRRCSKCNSKGSINNPLETDHIIPLSRGGSNAKINLRVLCKNCNMARRRGK
jgi:5-methylcytosine-specific restriction endonuclease McrA